MEMFKFSRNHEIKRQTDNAAFSFVYLSVSPVIVEKSEFIVPKHPVFMGNFTFYIKIQGHHAPLSWQKKSRIRKIISAPSIGKNTSGCDLVCISGNWGMELRMMMESIF
jgi:hypothetical protein